MNPIEIYKKYQIMPNLQIHQLRVAGVALAIIRNLTVPVDEKAILNACLFHDMGNIIKFDLSYFPEFVQPEGLEYWEKVKQDFIEKYGNEEHHATLLICQELGFSKKDLELLNAVGFSRALDTFKSGSIEKMICCYADQRVGPHGVISLDQRFADGAKRYENKPERSRMSDQRYALAQALKDMEAEIFKQAKIKPEEVNDEVVNDLIEFLKSR